MVVKLLVSDEFIDQVDTKVLQFNFLSISLVTAERLELQPVKPVEPVEPEVKPVPVSSTVCSDAALAALATSEAAVAEEGRRRKRAEEELLEAKAVAQAKDLERLEAQLQAKADAKRAQELELSRSEQVHAKALLEKELATQEQQNQALKETHKQLEDQLRFSNENAQRFQINITSTDQALELLKQRAASDAKEREELQRRLRILEEEKLALQRKSRACTLQ
ncbi:hypothetical protein PHYBOEH_006292 [Phytophthora boehmeriae]|uniref:Uncharacterized protein n=1 Tax=Phytophthora boehmeriae TaxID=109152 RepID=A0A8T1WHQ8_9STRA|nr:hypothetical protein PHYBOEH_006292 [Phytophthora boehmeriae]